MKGWLFAFIFLATLGILFIVFNPKVIKTTVPHPETVSELQTVKNRVSEFALTFKMVPLLATSTLAATMDQYYRPYVSAELLSKWKDDPSLAPGRETSSPWPDHAQIDSIEKQQDGTYRVIANIVELTSATTTPAALMPVYMRLQNASGTWMVVELQKNPYTED